MAIRTRKNVEVMEGLAEDLVKLGISGGALASVVSLLGDEFLEKRDLMQARRCLDVVLRQWREAEKRLTLAEEAEEKRG